MDKNESPYHIFWFLVCIEIPHTHLRPPHNMWHVPVLPAAQTPRQAQTKNKQWNHNSIDNSTVRIALMQQDDDQCEDGGKCSAKPPKFFYGCLHNYCGTNVFSEYGGEGLTTYNILGHAQRQHLHLSAISSLDLNRICCLNLKETIIFFSQVYTGIERKFREKNHITNCKRLMFCKSCRIYTIYILIIF